MANFPRRPTAEAAAEAAAPNAGGISRSVCECGEGKAGDRGGGGARLPAAAVAGGHFEVFYSIEQTFD